MKDLNFFNKYFSDLGYDKPFINVLKRNLSLSYAIFTGLSVRTKGGASLRCRCGLSSYIAGIPESKDYLSVKNGTLTSLSFMAGVSTKYGIDQHCQYPF